MALAMATERPNSRMLLQNKACKWGITSWFALTQRHTRSMRHSWKFLRGGSVQLLHAVELGAGMEPGMLANHQYMCEVTFWSLFCGTLICHPCCMHWILVWTRKFVGISSRSYKIIQISIISHNFVSCLLCCLVLHHSWHRTLHCPVSSLTQKPFW